MPNIFHHYQPSTAPPKALPPYQFTVAAFTPTIGPNKLSLTYAVSDVAMPQKALPPYQFTEPAWEAASRTFLNSEQWYVLGDLLTAPPFKPPAPVTIDHWLATIGAKVFGFGTFALGDIYTAPVRVLPTPPAVVLMPSWFQEVARASVVIAKVLGDLHTAPVMNPAVAAAVVSLASWFRDTVAAVENWNVLGDIFTAPPLSPPALITVDSFLQYLVQASVFLKYQQGDLLTHPEFLTILPPAAVTIDHWLQLLANNAQPLKYSTGDKYTAPDKVLPFIAPTVLFSWMLEQVNRIVQLPYSRIADATLHGSSVPVMGPNRWQHFVNQAAITLRYLLGDASASPLLPQPPAPITLDHWLQILAQNNLPQVYKPGDTQTSPDKVLPTLTTESLDSWLQYLAANGVRLNYAASDTYAAPSKVLPPAPITLDHWLQMLAQNNLPQTYKLGDTQTAPDKVLPFIAPAVLLSWMLDQANRIVQQPAFSRIADAMLHGAQVPVIGPNRWQHFVNQAAIVLQYWTGDIQTAPDKALPTLTVETLDSWLQYLVANGVRLVYSAGDTATAPAKTLPTAPITLDHWLQLLAANAQPAKFARGDTSTKPEATLPTTTFLTLDSWLQYLAANAVQLNYSPSDTYTAPDKVLPAAIIIPLSVIALWKVIMTAASGNVQDVTGEGKVN